MGFGHGFTGLLVASIVALSSGVAFIICFREFVRELFSRPMPSFDKSLRRKRNILLDDGGGFVVDDIIFNQLLQRRNEISTIKREWQDPTTYLFTIAFLGVVAAAGFIAGISHFA
jgi:hypothetical protein